MKIKASFCFAWILVLSVMFAAQPATAQADLACSGLTRTLSVNWPQFGFTPCGARSNPNEFVLGPTTVKNLQVKWHYILDDGGSVSPAVVNGVLYVDGDSYSENVDYLYALDANTGAQLWRQPRGTQSPSSPAVANGRVFIGDLDSNVYAFDARTGAPLWTFTTGNQVWGSPTVANGVVYVVSRDGTTYALDAATGTQLWMHPGGGIFVWGTPAVAYGLVYTPLGSGLYALDAQTGATRWSLSGSMQYSSPAVANGAVYAGLDGGTLYALTASTGALRWKTNVGNGMNGFALGNGRVYVGSTDGNSNGRLNCINASTGALVWSVATGAAGLFSSSPALANGVVYVLGGNSLDAFDASTGAMLWQDVSVEPTNASPSVVNGVLYITASGPYAYHLPSQR